MKIKNFCVIGLFLLSLLISACTIDKDPQEDKINNPPGEVYVDENPREGYESLAIYIEEMDINISEHGFDLMVSPDGNYLAFGGSIIGENGELEGLARIFQVNLNNGEMIILDEAKYYARVLGWANNSDKIIYFKDSDLYQYDHNNKSSKMLDKGVVSGSISPISDRLAYKSSEEIGIWISDFDGNNKIQITHGRDDWSPLWNSTEDALYYFKDTGLALGDGAGNAQGIYKYSLENQKIERILSYEDESDPRNIPRKYSEMEWLVQDKIIKIVSGWDDLFHEHLYNVETKEFITLVEDIIGGVDYNARDLNLKENLYLIVTGEEVKIYNEQMSVLNRQFENESTIIDIKILDESRYVYIEGTWSDEALISKNKVVYSNQEEDRIIQGGRFFSGITYNEVQDSLIYFEHEVKPTGRIVPKIIHVVRLTQGR